MQNKTLILILSIVLAIFAIVFVVLLAIFIYQKSKEIKEQKEIEKLKKIEEGDTTTYLAKSYTKHDIKEFMNFDKIEDNMIIQENGTKYLMVIECQGVNYDLMSETEKNAVEEGFQEFLNTLRTPIQIYTQTRSVNLESSLVGYRERLDIIKDKFNRHKIEYENAIKTGNKSDSELQQLFYDYTKQKNLYEYGKDIIANTEKMSLNKNVLNKKYYVIVAYNSQELGVHDFKQEEVQNIAFTELYTKAQSIIRALGACDISSTILDSVELIELLYMSYNRDEAESYGIQKLIRSTYEELYSTAPDVFEKKLKSLQDEIEKNAFDKANEIVEKIYSKKQKEVKEKEENIDDLINDFAKLILEQSESNIGKDVKEQAIKELEKEAIEKEEKEKEEAANKINNQKQINEQENQIPSSEDTINKQAEEINSNNNEIIFEEQNTNTLQTEPVNEDTNIKQDNDSNNNLKQNNNNNINYTEEKPVKRRNQIFGGDF